jgi:type VI secretion system FHA domain protein
VLADEYVSRQHARVTCRNGQFFIEDLDSKTGVTVNDERLPSKEPHPIRPGDRLLIEPYDIVVAPVLTVPIGSPSNLPGGSELVPGLPIESVVDPLKALFGEPSPNAPWNEPRPLPPVSPGGEVLKEVAAVAVPPPVPVSPPARELPVGGIPVDWHKGPVATAQPDLGPSPSAPLASSVDAPVSPLPGPRPLAEGVQQPSVEIKPTSSTHEVSELLAGAGVKGCTITPQMARQLGQILRVVVAGVLDVLHARQQTKEAFRIPGTIIRPKANNPLKHSTDVDDAFYNLFVKGGMTYLGPVEAFEDAFEDVKNHQLAMLQGIRATFRATLERFDPDRLQERFERTSGSRKKGAFDRLKGSPDYWEMYRAWVHGLSEDADGSFRSLFGEVFSEAYEDQLQQLKASRKGSRDDKP